MSVFLVNENHINTIVSYFITPVTDNKLQVKVNGQWKAISLEDGSADALAKVLWDENAQSVANRYNEKIELKEYKFQFFPEVHRAYSAGEIAKALDCLEYQSCESEGFSQSEAREIILAMRKHLLREIYQQESDEYDWEITSRKEMSQIK